MKFTQHNSARDFHSKPNLTQPNLQINIVHCLPSSFHEFYFLHIYEYRNTTIFTATVSKVSRKKKTRKKEKKGKERTGCSLIQLPMKYHSAFMCDKWNHKSRIEDDKCLGNSHLATVIDQQDYSCALSCRSITVLWRRDDGDMLEHVRRWIAATGWQWRTLEQSQGCKPIHRLLGRSPCWSRSRNNHHRGRNRKGTTGFWSICYVDWT